MESLLETIMGVFKDKYPNAWDFCFDSKSNSWIFRLSMPDGHYSVTITDSMKPNAMSLGVLTPYEEGKEMKMFFHHFDLSGPSGENPALSLAQEMVVMLQRFLRHVGPEDNKTLQ
ncbi:MAG: hypothetical protein LBF40_03000 [Deltaproteobacteria bacterium]|jgi:hypothetical protein|nr:hypothetical protein [Deltaproteobacteria bacterium]